MCINLGSKKTVTPGKLPDAEPIADPTEIGDARMAEDETLFGGVPDLRVDRSATGGGIASGGSGLGTM